MTQIADLKTFDVADYLDSEEKIAEYLAVVLEDNDPTLLAAALGDVARARGMTQLARDTVYVSPSECQDGHSTIRAARC